eukprot:scaffold3142_cov416-Prasinococcus_capsulatus_cf.AAC.3
MELIRCTLPIFCKDCAQYLCRIYAARRAPSRSLPLCRRKGRICASEQEHDQRQSSACCYETPPEDEEKQQSCNRFLAEARRWYSAAQPKGERKTPAPERRPRPRLSARRAATVRAGAREAARTSRHRRGAVSCRRWSTGRPRAPNASERLRSPDWPKSCALTLDRFDQGSRGSPPKSCRYCTSIIVGGTFRLTHGACKQAERAALAPVAQQDVAGLLFGTALLLVMVRGPQGYLAPSRAAEPLQTLTACHPRLEWHGGGGKAGRTRRSAVFP